MSEPGGGAPAPSLRSYFGSPKSDDDVFSQLSGGDHSAVMASQACLTQAALGSQPGLAGHLPPEGAEQPPQLQQVSEMAPNIEETIKQELQEAIEYEERRPRFSIGPDLESDIADDVEEVLGASNVDRSSTYLLEAPSTASVRTAESVSSMAVNLPGTPVESLASCSEASLCASETVASLAEPRPPSPVPPPSEMSETVPDPDFGDVPSEEVEDVSLTDDSQPCPPAPAPPVFDYFTQTSAGSAELEMSLAPDQDTAAAEEGSDASPLPNTEMDRQHDAWVPSEQTQSILSTLAQSLPGTFYPSRENLTLPGCVLLTDLTDPVSELMTQYMPAAEAKKRSVLTADSVTQDDRGIRQLIEAGCYRAAVNLTGRLLANYGQGTGRVGQVSKHTANSVQLWFTRFALLVRLRQFALAEQEAEAWGDLDTPDLYFQYYPDLYGGRRGSMVPFSFRVLLAELPRYVGKYQTSLDKLYQIHSVCQQIVTNLTSGLSEDGSPSDLCPGYKDQSLKLWRQRKLRVLFSVVNCCVGMKDYELAIECLESSLLPEVPEHSVGLLSAVGRVYLQLGNLTAARHIFNRIKALTADTPAVGTVEGSAPARQPRAQTLLNDALLAIADNNFVLAQERFQQVLDVEPDNATVLTNIAVCLLYQGRLADAVNRLETAVLSRPEALLQETVLLNLCTLYELQTSRCNKKKVDLLAKVGAHRGDGFNIGCLKLQPTVAAG